MEKLVFLLPALGCAAMMGVMMLMMRGNHGGPGQPSQSESNTEDIAVLRAEVAALRAQQAGQTNGADRGTGS